MQIVLDVNDSYEAQFMTILQSLDKRFFSRVQVDKNSQFAEYKTFLENELREIDGGKAKMLSIDEFDTIMDSVLAEYENRA